MAQITIGRILPIFKGNWSSSTTYSKLDIVYYNGSSYVAKTQNTNQVPTNTFYWQIVAIAGSWSTFSDAEKASLIDYLADVVDSDTINVVGTELNLTQKLSNVDSAITNVQSRVATNTNNIATLQTRTTTNTNNIATLQSSVTTNANNIASLQSSVSTNTNDIASLQSGQSTLQGRVTTAERNITSLDHGLSTLENDINTLGGRVTTNTSNITALQSSVATNTNDIASLQEEADNYDLVNTNRGDFELSDNDGNVLLRLANGHIITKNFNSSNASSDLAQAVATNTSNISSLQSSVATNTNDIATLQTNTTTNTNNIATLQSSVSTNTSNITALQSSTTTNTNDITTLQSESIPLYANLPTRYDSSGNKIIKILGIGNSWTVDYTEYLPRVLENAGYTVTIGVFYRGGAFLEDVYKCMTGTLDWGYSLLYETSTGHWTTSSSTDYLYTYTDWDVIILNEGTTANSYSTYQPYLNNIIDLLFTKLTHPVKIGLSVVESKNDGDTEAVWRGIVNASISAYNDSYLDFLIPVGTTAQNYRNCTTLMNALVNSTYGSDVLYTSSGQHLREGLPILSASYTLAMSLAGIGIWSDSTVPNASLISSLQIPSLQQHAAPIASDSVASNRMLVQKCVKNAFKNWTKITSI